MSVDYDVAVIGAGVVGCAIARELAAITASLVLLEAQDDIGDGTSKANTAILHTGFDATPGTLESRLVARGYHLLGDYAKATGIAVERTGAVVVAWDDEQVAVLPRLAEKADKNGYPHTEIVDADAVYAMLPELAPGARSGLLVPGESIIDPWSVSLAFVNDAVARGAELRRGCRVTGATSDAETTTLVTDQGAIRARWVVNASGLGADLIDAFFGYDRFHVVPRRGELIVFDKLARRLAPRIVLPVPSSRGKGVLVSPTVFGNVMLGPTADDIEDRTDTSTSEEGISRLLDKGRMIMPALLKEEVTSMYAGVRAATEHSDYLIATDAQQRYVCVGGIRSTGLTASMAIAEHVREQMTYNGFTDEQRDDLPPLCRVPNLGEAFLRPYQRDDLIATDPEYGTVVCFCERVTRGEIRDALASPVPPRDLDGLRRRTRALMGRCQGFYCGAEVERLLEEGTQ